jgi:hypothetical protein
VKEFTLVALAATLGAFAASVAIARLVAWASDDGTWREGRDGG